MPFLANEISLGTNGGFVIENAAPRTPAMDRAFGDLALIAADQAGTFSPFSGTKVIFTTGDVLAPPLRYVQVTWPSS